MILVTGGTGFVGTHIIRQLIRDRVPVRLVVRKSSKISDEFRDSLESIVTVDDVFAQDDLWWAEVCSDIDAVLHCAWYAEPVKYIQSHKNIDCLIGTLSMAKGLIKADVDKVVGLGTCFEYGLSNDAISVDACLRPASIYGATKVACYLALSELFKLNQIDFAWCRLFHLYGRGEDPRKLNAYIHQQLKDGNSVKLGSGREIRDFIEVTEAARQIVKVLLEPICGPINICSGVGVSVREFAEKIADTYGRRDLLQFNKREKNPVDPDRIVGVNNLLNSIDN